MEDDFKDTSSLKDKTARIFFDIDDRINDYFDRTDKELLVFKGQKIIDKSTKTMLNHLLGSIWLRMRQLDKESGIKRTPGG